MAPRRIGRGLLQYKPPGVEHPHPASADYTVVYRTQGFGHTGSFVCLFCGIPLLC